jgi:ribosome biogenesis ATPase
VNTLLTELDGLNDRKGVYVIGATNRPDIIDPAMIRPGRLDSPLFVALPEATDRDEILKTLTKKTPLAEDVNFNTIAHDPRARNFRYFALNPIRLIASGADLSALVRQAAIWSLKEILMNNASNGDEGSPSIKVKMEHFNQALDSLRPSVSDQDRRRYEHLRTVFDIVR